MNVHLCCKLELSYSFDTTWFLGANLVSSCLWVANYVYMYVLWMESVRMIIVKFNLVVTRSCMIFLADNLWEYQIINRNESLHFNLHAHWRSLTLPTTSYSLVPIRMNSGAASGNCRIQTPLITLWNMIFLRLEQRATLLPSIELITWRSSILYGSH